jgi:stage III sporulation protein AG
MEGVGAVEVMITLKDTGELVLDKDLTRSESIRTEEDTQGSGGRSDQSLSTQESAVRSENGTDSSPFIAKEVKPQVEGVLVVAQGGGSPTVVKNISEAVLALFPIEAHKIKVVRKTG